MVSEDCGEAIEKKNEAYLHYMERPTRVKKERFQEPRRSGDKLCRKKKRRHLYGILSHINRDVRSNNTRKAFSIVKQLKAGFKPKTNLFNPL